ncbi:MAG: MDR family oxidoreductase [Pseudomonadota bacterium]
MTFKAFVIDKTDAGQTARWQDFNEDALMDGDVDIDVTHSTINYKDGLAITGKAPVVRRWPMIPGIDLAGTVTASRHDGFAAGDQVVLNGWGVGETHLGGYAQKARLKGDWLIKKPDALSAAETMAIGTAGYTAMLCVMALERGGVAAGHGPILVTGAAGGVGSVAVTLLADAGHEVVASTGREDEADYLKSLGASTIVPRAELSEPGRPLGKERFAGVIDVAGSHTLANALAQTRYGGAVAACGLAQGMDLPTSVAPFILRGVTLFGVDSVMAPKALREAAWSRLAANLDRGKLAAMTQTHPVSEVETLAADIMKGQIRGRVVLTIDG